MAEKKNKTEILQLTLMRKWFEMIRSGEKRQEYRAIKRYWSRRLTTNPKTQYILGLGETPYTIHRRADDIEQYQGEGLDPRTHYFAWDVKQFKEEAKWREFTAVRFRNGYGKDAPEMLVECKGISIGHANPDWSDAHEHEVFIIELGDIIESNHQEVAAAA